MTLDIISAEMTYVIYMMWGGEQFRNVSVLKINQVKAVLNVSLMTGFVNRIFWVMYEFVCNGKLATFVINKLT